MTSSFAKGFVSGLLCLILSLGLFFGTAGWWMPRADAPEAADAILILGGDYSRALKAAKLYKQGLAPRVYLCSPMRGDGERLLESLGWPAGGEAEMSRFILEKSGVPAEAVTVYGEGVLSTVEEIEALAAILPDSTRSLLVVSAPTHTRRAGWVVERLLPGRTIRMISQFDMPMRRDWWNNKQLAYEVVLESVKMPWYLLGGVYRNLPGGRRAP